MKKFLSYLQPFIRVCAFFGCYLFLMSFASALLIPFLGGVNPAELGQSELESLQRDPSMLLLMQLGSLIGFLFTLFIFTKIPPRKDYVQFGLIGENVMKDIARGAGVGAAVIVLSFLVLWATGTVQSFTFNPDLSIRLVIVWFGIFLIVAFVEEVMIRGYFLHIFMERYTPLASVGITSLLFGSMHFLNPSFGWIGFVNILLAGLLMGLIFFVRQTIWLPLGVHFGWNFVQGTVLGFHVSGIEGDAIFRHNLQGDSLLSGGEFGLEGSLITTGVCLGVIILVFVYGRLNFQPVEFEMYESD